MSTGKPSVWLFSGGAVRPFSDCVSSFLIGIFLRAVPLLSQFVQERQDRGVSDLFEVAGGGLPGGLQCCLEKFGEGLDIPFLEELGCLGEFILETAVQKPFRAGGLLGVDGQCLLAGEFLRTEPVEGQQGPGQNDCGGSKSKERMQPAAGEPMGEVLSADELVDPAAGFGRE